MPGPSQLSLFPSEEKSYRAKRHDVVRKKQRENSTEVHHPHEKIAQISRVLPVMSGRCLQLFAGEGNLDEAYREKGLDLVSYDKKLGTGDSFRECHRLIADREIFEVVDADPYGFPNRLLPDLFLLIDDGYLFMTMPKPHVNILNGITQQHNMCYWGEENPSLDVILKRLHLYGLCHWRDCQFEAVDLGRLWRIAARVVRVKATEYTGTRNR